MESSGAAICLTLKIQAIKHEQIPHPAISNHLICFKQSAFQNLKGKEGENLIWSQNRSH